MRTRKSGENIADFLADLRYLSRNCDFKAGTDEMIRDRLVCGVGDLPIQRKLLGETELDLKKATKIAVGMETANKEAANLGGTREIHGVDQVRKKESWTKSGEKEACYRCGDPKHRAPDCSFRDKECFLCKKKGHISRVCSQRKKAGKSSSIHKLEQSVGNLELESQPRGSGETGKTDIFGIRFDADDEVCYFVNRTEVRKESPIIIRVEVDNREIPMELDTGASISVAGRKEWEAATGRPIDLKPTNVKLKTFGGKVIEPLGAAQINVDYRGQKKCLPIVVTNEPGPILLGRNWLRELNLDWKGVMAEIFPVVDAKVEVNPGGKNSHLNAVLEKYEEVFRDEQGTMKDVVVSLPLKENAKPKWFRARSVPYTIKKAIDTELDRLVREGTYKPVSHSEWATPIVPRVKPDGTVRICGDYKLTVNPSAECDT
jgi:hypothetical protein